MHPLRGCNSIYFVILWNGIDSNLRRGECKVLVILEIPSHENSRRTAKNDAHLSPSDWSILSAVLLINHECGAVFPLCIHVIGLDGVFMSFTSRIRIRRYGSTHTRVVYRTYVLPHTCAPAPCGRERSIYTLRQLVNLASSF